MSRTLSRACLLSLSAGGLLAGVTGCADDESSAGSPGPFVASRCTLYWARESDGGEGKLDVFAVDQPVAKWVAGPGAYQPGDPLFGDGPIGWFAYRTLDGSLANAEALAKVTSGAFALTVSSLDEGDPVSFVDGTSQMLVDARGVSASVGTGGIGSFDGVWSDPRASNESDIEFSDGEISLTWLGSSISLGGDALGGESAYAQCSSEDSAFAPTSGPGGLQFIRSGTGKGSR